MLKTINSGVASKLMVSSIALNHPQNLIIISYAVVPEPENRVLGRPRGRQLCRREHTIRFRRRIVQCDVASSVIGDADDAVAGTPKFDIVAAEALKGVDELGKRKTEVVESGGGERRTGNGEEEVAVGIGI